MSLKTSPDSLSAFTCATLGAMIGRSHGKLSRFTATQFTRNEAVEVGLDEVRIGD